MATGNQSEIRLNVRRKLLVLIAFVAVVPLGVSAYQSLQIHQSALEDAHSELHGSSAKFGAVLVNDRLTSTLSGLRALASDSVNWPNLSEEERTGAVWFIYAQVESSLIVSLLDSQGEGIGPSAFMGEASPEYPRRHSLSEAALASFAQHIPHQEALRQGEVVGEPFLTGDLLVLPIALSISGPAGERWVLAAGIELNGLCSELGRLGGTAAGQRLSLFDARQRTLCELGRAGRLSRAASGLRDVVAKPAGSFKYEQAGASGPTTVLAATASTFREFRVVAAQPSDELYAAGQRIRTQSLLWLGVGVISALVGGLILAQSIHTPLRRLTEGVRRIAAGELDVQLNAKQTDEIGELARNFDTMMTQIRKRDQEIRSWNEELQARVEERTRELKAATDALLESRTIAAMASLGAGVAHEINNPLTGVLGMTQLLLARARKASVARDVALLESVEREALRIGELVKKMAQLTEPADEASAVELPGRQLLLSAVTAERQRLAACNVSVEQAFEAPAVMVRGNPYQLTELFQRIIDNSIKAMCAKGGILSVGAKKLDSEWVEFRITDTGRGIRPEHVNKAFEPFFTTKDAWQGEGLGLTLAYRIVEAHGGKIDIRSEWQQGTTVVVTLPAARLGSHMV